MFFVFKYSYIYRSYLGLIRNLCWMFICFKNLTEYFWPHINLNCRVFTWKFFHWASNQHFSPNIENSLKMFGDVRNLLHSLNSPNFSHSFLLRVWKPRTFSRALQIFHYFLRKKNQRGTFGSALRSHLIISLSNITKKGLGESVAQRAKFFWKPTSYKPFFHT